MKKLTIFTPTYNRAYCLKNIYDSLKNQTCKDFVWLIIDDGSIDDTAELITSFINESCIEIELFKQNNAGKHVAHNKAIELCNTELFICVDSDDTLIPTAVDTIFKRFFSVKRENLLGMYFRRIDKDGNRIATEYPIGINRVGITDLYHRYKFLGDAAIVMVTEMIKGTSFPVFENERFVSERVFYNLLNDIAPMALFDDGIYVCEYLPDGYTNNTKKLMMSNPQGTAMDCLSESIYGTKLVYRVKSYAQFLALCTVFSISRKNQYYLEKPSIIIQGLALIIKPHYKKFFTMQREDVRRMNE